MRGLHQLCVSHRDRKEVRQNIQMKTLFLFLTMNRGIVNNGAQVICLIPSVGFILNQLNQFHNRAQKEQ